jgi:hypothetical protein
MVLSLILLVLAVGVAMFHYVEGAFTATLSAMFAILAAVIAVGYHENLAQYMVDAKYPDQASALALVVIFAVAYIVPRFLADKFVPGNIRLPVLADKIIAGAMGFVAGLFCTGVLGLAAQTLPYGPSIGFFTRYEVDDREASYTQQNGVKAQDTIPDELAANEFKPGYDGHLWLHQDELVLGTTSGLSGGSLSGDRKVTDVHPDLLAELFAARVGVPQGARHSAVNNDTVTDVKVDGLYNPPSLPQTDGEITEIRKGNEKVEGTFKPESDTQILVVSTHFSDSKNLADSDQILRISPANVRLMANGANYFPIGTVSSNRVLVKYRLDDILPVDLRDAHKGEAIVDFAYIVPSDTLVKDTSSKDKKLTMPQGSFIEAKKFARVDLSGMEITDTIAKGDDGVIRKTDVSATLDKMGAGAPEPSSSDQPADTTKKPKKPKPPKQQ